MPDQTQIVGIIVAAIGGAAVGVERQQSGHATGLNARFGGVRTFTLLGGLAGVGGMVDDATVHRARGRARSRGDRARDFGVRWRRVDMTWTPRPRLRPSWSSARARRWRGLAGALQRHHRRQLAAAGREIGSALARRPHRRRGIARRGAVRSHGGRHPAAAACRAVWSVGRNQAARAVAAGALLQRFSFAGYIARRLVGRRPRLPGRRTARRSGVVDQRDLHVRPPESPPNAGFRGLSRSVPSARARCFSRVVLAASVLDVDVASAVLPYVVAPFALGG